MGIDINKYNAIENISQKANHLKQKLDEAQEKIIVAMQKNREIISRSKSTEPRSIPMSKIFTSKYSKIDRNSVAKFIMTWYKLKAKRAFRQWRKLWYSQSGKQHQFISQKMSNSYAQNKCTSNERYNNEMKSSLDEWKTFESLEEELKSVIANQKQWKNRSESCQKCGKTKRKRPSKRSPRTHSQVNHVKIAKPKPSKSPRPSTLLLRILLSKHNHLLFLGFNSLRHYAQHPHPLGILLAQLAERQQRKLKRRGMKRWKEVMINEMEERKRALEGLNKIVEMKMVGKTIERWRFSMLV
jgi:peptidyl-tRNA hydrolase